MTAVYVPPTFKTRPGTNIANGALASNFRNLAVDGSRVSMTGALGNYIQTRDATASPVTSPLSLSTSQTLTIPSNAAQITIYSSAALNVTEDSADVDYFVLPLDTIWTFDVANMEYLYLFASAATVQFYFTMI